MAGNMFWNMMLTSFSCCWAALLPSPAPRPCITTCRGTRRPEATPNENPKQEI